MFVYAVTNKYKLAIVIPKFYNSIFENGISLKQQHACAVKTAVWSVEVYQKRLIAKFAAKEAGKLVTFAVGRSFCFCLHFEPSRSGRSEIIDKSTASIDVFAVT